MRRIGIAGFQHETNTFSNTPTPLENFLNQSGFYPELLAGKEMLKFAEGKVNIAASGFMVDAEKNGFTIVPLVWTGTEPSQPMKIDVFEHLMGLIEKAIVKNQPYDGIFLDLHGAMVYGDLQDGEEEILRRVRAIVGDIPIVVSLDLHGNINKESFNLATVMVGYRTYPHVDGFENGQRCAAVMNYFLRGGTLYKAFRQSPFLMPATTQPTTKEPAISLYALLPEVERWEGVVSATVMEGFNACDLPHTGPSVFTYAIDQAAADKSADFLLEGMLEREAQFSVEMYPPEEAVEKALQMAEGIDNPVILVDVQDNAGGGSPSDTVWLLEAIVKRGVRRAAVGVIWDPRAAELAHAAGEGAQVQIALGGHSLPGHNPFEAEFKVEKLHEGGFLGTGPMVKGRTLNLGKMAQLRVDDIRIVVSSDRMQALDQSLFRVVGIEPGKMAILVLKSANHYRADFGSISGGIINVDAPSAILEDPSKIAYTRLREGVRLKGKGPEFHKS